ncbi:hypothetical protein PABY_21220 [Pyrodictium abyssi]|uniref:DNA-directed RNA polymerase n=1 Tax=Pyrodictium abyssi TaxID=54256 RepID=A0ABN6ZUC7_9CREN|nr:hypothetical protein PABY_21220 [Pyrodictium abyssi]
MLSSNWFQKLSEFYACALKYDNLESCTYKLEVEGELPSELKQCLTRVLDAVKRCIDEQERLIEERFADV